MAKHVKHSVVPIYLAGAVWLVFGLFFSLYRVGDYALCAGLSLVAYVAGKALFPDKSYDLPGEKAEEKKPEEKKKDEKKEAKPKSTGNPDIDKLIVERDRALGEMRRLNDAIEDEKISAQIDHLEMVTRKIIDQVVAQPKKLPQIRKFMNYYLPTTLKILRAYGQLESQQVSGENITAAMERIEGMMDKVVEGFEKQLDQLFQGDAMDIATDVEVLERMLAKDGLSSSQGMTLGL